MRDILRRRVLATVQTPCGRRVVQIYRLWRRADGEALVEAYQTSGCSAWALPVGWKTLRLSDITIEATGARRFRIRDDFQARPARPIGEVVDQIDLPRPRARDERGQQLIPDVLPRRPAP